MFKILIKKDINNSISLQEKAEAIGLGDKYNMLKNFMKSCYFNLVRTGIILTTRQSPLAGLKCPERKMWIPQLEAKQVKMQ